MRMLHRTCLGVGVLVKVRSVNKGPNCYPISEHFQLIWVPTNACLRCRLHIKLINSISVSYVCTYTQFVHIFLLKKETGSVIGMLRVTSAA